MKSSEREEFYEKTDFSDLIKLKGKKIGGIPKRISLNISEKIYDEANELDSYMKMGYQNVLKTAMTIGLTELYNQVSNHRVIKATSRKITKTNKSKTLRARKKQAVQTQSGDIA